MSSREERATYLPEAFTPPGLQLTPPGSSEAGSPLGLGPSAPSRGQRGYQLPSAMSAMGRAAGGGGGCGGGSRAGVSGGAGVVPRSVCTTPEQLLAALHRRRQREEQAQAGGAGPAAPLPSGEALLAVLAEVKEDVGEYVRHVWRGKSALERFGGGPRYGG
jgi:hypothetical protein